MVRNSSDFSTSGSNDRKSSQERKLALPERTRTQSPPINNSAIANNRITAINPASPAHDLRGQAVGERLLRIQSTHPIQLLQRISAFALLRSERSDRFGCG
jgi:hypothetical protein